MSGSSGLARPRPGLATREVAFLLIVAAGAWAATIALARGMAGMTGTMGLGLAALVLTEKVWRWGPVAGRIAGAAALALAVATIWLPWLAPGLHAAPPMMMG